MEIELINKEGEIIYSTEEHHKLFKRIPDKLFSYFQQNSLEVNKELIEYIMLKDLSSETDEFFVYDIQSGYREFKGLGWFLLIEYDAEILFIPITNMRNLIMTMLVVIFIIAILSGIFISRSLSKPIINLRDSVEKINKGNISTDIKVNTKDEIGDLAHSFQRMTKELKESYDSLDDKVKQRTIELEESQNQLKENVMELERNRIAMMNITKDLQELNETLEEKVKYRTEEVNKLLKQKDEFINQLGHDLKNPIGPIINLLPLLENEKNESEKKEILEIIERNVSHIKNLVTKTIEFGKLNSTNVHFNLDETNLIDEINNVILRNKPFFKENNIEVENKISDNFVIKTDKIRFSELFDNIISNSIKYSPDGGKIIIDAKNENDFVIISVKDTGIGMNKEQISRVFDEFYKADEARQDFDSSGLGMAIAKRIVEKQGGKIWVESKGTGKGSTFYFRIPNK